MVVVNSDKDNNSAVISLGEMYSDNTAQHLSSTGSPPLPPTSGATADEVLPHRASVNRCGSPPTGRSVSFMCGHTQRSEMDGSSSTRMSGRRQSATVGEQKETAAGPVLTVTGSPSAHHHIEYERSSKVESVHTDVTTSVTCPSGVHVCKCVNSRLSDVEGCRLPSADSGTPHENYPYPTTSDVEVDETGQSHILSKQTAAPECCVIHVSTSS